MLLSPHVDFWTFKSIKSLKRNCPMKDRVPLALSAYRDYIFLKKKTFTSQYLLKKRMTLFVLEVSKEKKKVFLFKNLRSIGQMNKTLSVYIAVYSWGYHVANAMTNRLMGTSDIGGLRGILKIIKIYSSPWLEYVSLAM